ncbi:GntR family transcriptional regulator [Sporosarcina sp. P37]|uniref:FadR/GntR family transcriptional regulator n=1 Tax=unclassified Sporosarcina TaxID=2647733 RepID=UPI0009BEC602|nr:MULTISPECIES: FadR/GntR family transcriptional regulator [unclassified Sporosarcina]ARD47841.1 GntR family transcriptional regulator [Sporosarcina sp. P33]ARK24369.1 GntR family transcriptional regulator [Sporosarcina sp. P37]PID17448.1 FadR family transcriptional regulator [Sporosarcina sp. P35]
MQYKQIKPKKIYEEVADALVHLIRSGKLKPGDKLDSVQQLAQNFNVGRSAVREALTSLRAMGLIEMRQGEGTYVLEFSSDGLKFPLHSAMLMSEEDVFHLLGVRKILEAGAAHAAAVNRTDEDLVKMEEALVEMKQHAGDIVLGEKADLDFHFAVARASGNPILVSLMNHVSDLMSESMRETRRICLYSKTAAADRLHEEHEAILTAIKNQSPDAAALNMQAHLQNVESVLSEYMRTLHP